MVSPLQHLIRVDTIAAIAPVAPKILERYGMGIEQAVNYQLNKYPVVKRVVKRAYQGVCYAASPKIKAIGDIQRLSPADPNHEYFFGYYDKSPWDRDEQRVLCMRANDTWSDVSPDEPADIMLIDLREAPDDPMRIVRIAQTSTWNVQQGCMAQWLGPDFSKRVLYNDLRDGRYSTVILDLESGKERVIGMPSYTVSQDGVTALTLDFSRLYNLRPGYGYRNLPETTEGDSLPDAPAVWRINLETGETTPILSYADFASFEPREETLNPRAVHKVNHLMLSPNGKRCMVLYRWLIGQRKYTRLITFDPTTGKDMYVLSDDDMVSHCYWKDDEHILAFENKHDGGPGYYLMRDKSQEYIRCWPELIGDGHPSYSPDRSLVVTDSYPDRARMQELRVMSGDESVDEVRIVARVHSPFRYDNDTRCDLHPRWSRSGHQIAFDSVFEGHRGLYAVSAKSEIGIPQGRSVEIGMIGLPEGDQPLLSVVVPVYNVSTYLEKCVSSIMAQTYSNLEIILVDDGSTDSSGKMCDEFARNDNRIVVVHQENGGLSAARNAGLTAATGEYVGFVDSDDWVDLHMYEYLLALARQTDSDVAQVGYIAAFDEGAEGDAPYGKATVYEGGDSILYHYMYQGISQIGAYSVCRCLFKRELLSGLSYRVGKVNEDMDFKYRALKRCERYAESECRQYFYRQRDASTTNGGLSKKDFDLYDASLALVDLAEDGGSVRVQQLALEKLARAPFSLLSRIAYYGISDEALNAASVTRMLQDEVRHAWPIIIRSPMPRSRKLLATMYCVSMPLSKACVKIARKVLKQ